MISLDSYLWLDGLNLILIRPGLVQANNQQLEQNKIHLDRPSTLIFCCVLLCFFFKAPRSTGESCKILGAHADRTQHRRGCPSSLETRHTKAHAHLHTHARTPTHRPQHPVWHQRCDHGGSNAGGQPRNRERYHRATGSFACSSLWPPHLFTMHMLQMQRAPRLTYQMRHAEAPSQNKGYSSDKQEAPLGQRTSDTWLRWGFLLRRH